MNGILFVVKHTKCRSPRSRVFYFTVFIFSLTHVYIFQSLSDEDSFKKMSATKDVFEKIQELLSNLVERWDTLSM